MVKSAKIELMTMLPNSLTTSPKPIYLLSSDEPLLIRDWLDAARQSLALVRRDLDRHRTRHAGLVGLFVGFLVNADDADVLHDRARAQVARTILGQHDVDEIAGLDEARDAGNGVKPTASASSAGWRRH